MYDAITILRIMVFSPIAAFIIIVGLFYLLRYLFALKTSFSDCISTCFKSGIIAAGASLAVFVVWMVWASIKTKTDLGQAPLAWIFGFGPICFTIGTVVGFVIWCKSIFKHREKKTENS